MPILLWCAPRCFACIILLWKIEWDIILRAEKIIDHLGLQQFCGPFFIKEKTMPWLNTMYDHLGIMFFIVIAVITALAIIRSLVKMKKRKSINITPVGVFNDLPESVTGIRKDKEWEIEEEHHAD